MSAALFGLSKGFLGSTVPAKKYLNIGYNIYAENFGEKDPQTATILMYQGIVCFIEKDLEKSSKKFNEALTVFKNTDDYMRRKTCKEYLEKIEKLKNFNKK